MRIQDQILNNLKESYDYDEPLNIWVPYYKDYPEGNFTSFDEALKYAKENDCDEIEQHTWYNEEDYGVKSSDKYRIVWTKNQDN